MKQDTKLCLLVAGCFLILGIILLAISTTATEYIMPLYYIPAVACVFSGSIVLGLSVWTLE